jgi:hypothetical protein
MGAAVQMEGVFVFVAALTARWCGGVGVRHEGRAAPVPWRLSQRESSNLGGNNARRDSVVIIIGDDTSHSINT